MRDTEATEHDPRISPDRSRILGCACGWRVPTHGADSEDAIAMHVALAKESPWGTTIDS